MAGEVRRRPTRRPSRAQVGPRGPGRPVECRSSRCRGSGQRAAERQLVAPGREEGLGPVAGAEQRARRRGRARRAAPRRWPPTRPTPGSPAPATGQPANSGPAVVTKSGTHDRARPGAARRGLGRHRHRPGGHHRAGGQRRPRPRRRSRPGFEPATSTSASTPNDLPRLARRLGRAAPTSGGAVLGPRRPPRPPRRSRRSRWRCRRRSRWPRPCRPRLTMPATMAGPVASKPSIATRPTGQAANGGVARRRRHRARPARRGGSRRRRAEDRRPRSGARSSAVTPLAGSTARRPSRTSGSTSPDERGQGRGPVVGRRVDPGRGPTDLPLEGGEPVGEATGRAATRRRPGSWAPTGRRRPPGRRRGRRRRSRRWT